MDGNYTVYRALQVSFEKPFTLLLTAMFWQRTWVIQEVAAGREITLLYGQSYIAWDVLCKAISAISRSRLLNLDQAEAQKGLKNILTLHNIRLQIQDGCRLMSLAETMFLSHGFETKQDHDKVYALLGLAWDSFQYLDCTSYERKAKEIVWEMSRTYLERRRVLDFICLQGIGARKYGDLPSWAPDRPYLGDDPIRLRYIEYLCGNDRPSGSADNANRRWAATPIPKAEHYVIKIETKEIQINGRLIGTMDGLLRAPGSFDRGMSHRSQTFPAKQRKLGDNVTARDIAEWIYEILTIYKAATTYSNVGPCLKGIWSATLRPDPEHEQEFWNWLQECGSFRIGDLSIAVRANTVDEHLSSRKGKKLIKPLIPGPSWTKMTQEQKVSVKREQMTATINGLYTQYRKAMRLMSTTDGGCGWAHPDASPGDRIALFEGCSVPVILRLVTGGKEIPGYPQYHVVGDAYLAGAMQAQRWQSVLTRPRKNLKPGEKEARPVEVEYINLC